MEVRGQAWVWVLLLTLFVAGFLYWLLCVRQASWPVSFQGVSALLLGALRLQTLLFCICLLNVGSECLN